MKITKWIAAAALTLIAAAPMNSMAGDGDSYTVNTKNSTVKWKGTKVGGEHVGMIQFKSGSLQMDDGNIKGGNIVMDMNSITCTDIENAEYNGKLVGHLKSDDFFGVSQFPEAKMVIKSIKPAGGNKANVVASVTIKGITKDVNFELESTESNGTLTATGTVVIDRSDFNVKYASGSFFEGLGDKMIYDDFTLDFKLVASK
ncbi:YceI family protein [bacterium SCSIO 12741]|nr:YceI family protein [bacterium SCSIO 12741]